MEEKYNVLLKHFSESFLSSISNDVKDNLVLYITASKAYYDEEPLITDEQFDDLHDELLLLDIEEISNFIIKGIYNSIDETISEVNETTEMVSLFKIKYTGLSDIFEIKKFLGNGKINNVINYYFGPKLDGNAGKIKFNVDTKEIISIETRGGLNITEKFIKNKTLVETIKKINLPLVCGEFAIKKLLFEEKYKTDNYKNPRNFVGSLMKNSNVSEEIINDIDFIPYSDGKNPLLNNHFFNCWLELKNFNTIPDFFSFCKSDKFPYLCDGIVVSFIESGERQIKNNYPLNMVAVKFPAPTAITQIIGVEWSQKKSGNLTPTLILKPVDLDGATVSRANGYNYFQSVVSNKLCVGMEVEITRSGDIIPVIKKVITSKQQALQRNLQPIKLPECDYIVEGKHLKALNMEESRIHKFILGLKILQLDNIGPKNAELIGTIVDYNIIELFNTQHRPDIREILGGGKTYDKFANGFYSIKTLYLDQLIEMLQFNSCGTVLSRLFAFLITGTRKDTSGVNKELLNTICRGDGFQKIKESMNKLNTYGIKVLKPIEINDETISFEMTGNPPSKMTKDEFAKIVKDVYPNSIKTTLTKQTKVLFTDDLNKNGGKINKARKYNVKVISYSDFLIKKNID